MPGETLPFTLDNLPDSFRYDRTVAAYGVNGGVEQLGPTTFRTTDVAVHDQPRPTYWDDEIGDRPDISFATLARDPLPALHDLVDACERWGADHWAPEVLAPRADAEGWDDGMRAEANDEAAKFFEELARLRSGLALLETNARPAPQLHAGQPCIRRVTARRDTRIGGRSNSGSCSPTSRPSSTTLATAKPAVVDTLWFATGGGKTETYLLYVLTAAFYDRLRGKREGITSWGRFPLRMLSLQQTQRFADVLAAAELVRRDEHIGGREFSLGFFVGKQGTPNKIKRKPDFDAPDDPADADMPGRYQVLLRCPFCGSDDLQMRFDQTRWTLDHVCTDHDCPWGGPPLPFRIVDDEIYRSLPTVVLGTLDKAASISVQAAMRGFYGPPSGRCPAGVTGSPTRPGADRVAAASSPVATRPRVRWARTAACTRRLSGCRTSSTCCETAWAPSTRTTRHSSMRSRPTTVRCPRSSRHRPPSPGTPNKSRLCTAGQAARSRVPARSRPLLLVAQHRRARPPVRGPRATRGDARVRDRPADRVTTASDAAGGRGSGGRRCRDRCGRRARAPARL